MSSGIEANDTMFSVKARPWHGLGTVVQQAPTVAEAIRLAGLGWTVGLRSLWTVALKPEFAAQAKEQGADFKPEPHMLKVAERVPAQATYNTQNGQQLGVVGPTYTPLQNADAFDFFQPFIDSGLVSLETAGSLFNGRRIFITAKINSPDSVIVPQSDDRIEKFVLLSNSHDGTLAVRVGFTPIRVVCNNTLTMAHGDKASQLIKVRHGKNVVANMEALRETMDVVNQQFEATAEQYRYLASREISASDLRKYVNIVFQQERTEEEIEKSANAGRILPMIEELFESGVGNHLPGVRGTRWAAYNAVTEYNQAYRGKELAQRFSSVWFGDGARINKRALETALRLGTH